MNIDRDECTGHEQIHQDLSYRALHGRSLVFQSSFRRYANA